MFGLSEHGCVIRGHSMTG